jgi:hypothetical protein
MNSKLPDSVCEPESHDLTVPQARVSANHRKLRQIALKNYAK